MKCLYVPTFIALCLSISISHASNGNCDLPSGNYVFQTSMSDLGKTTMTIAHGAVTNLFNDKLNGIWKLSAFNLTRSGQCSQTATFTQNDQTSTFLLTWNPQKCMASSKPTLPAAGTEGVNSMHTCLIQIPVDTITLTQQDSTSPATTIHLNNSTNKKSAAH